MSKRVRRATSALGVPLSASQRAAFSRSSAWTSRSVRVRCWRPIRLSSDMKKSNTPIDGLLTCVIYAPRADRQASSTPGVRRIRVSAPLADVVELADTQDSGSCAERHEGPTPPVLIFYLKG